MDKDNAAGGQKEITIAIKVKDIIDCLDEEIGRGGKLNTNC